VSTEHSPEELLDMVDSRETFLTFVAALIEDRQQADALEAGDPQRYRWSGANGWENGTIAMFLEGALAYAQSPNWPERQSDAPTWRDLAKFLFLGKIYE
jgi:hypothetical protein